MATAYGPSGGKEIRRRFKTLLGLRREGGVAGELLATGIVTLTAGRPDRFGRFDRRSIDNGCFYSHSLTY